MKSLIDKPTYLIAELEGDVVPLVQNARERFSPGHIEWPVDITVAGSSGLGTIKEGQPLEEVVAGLEPIIKMLGFTEVTFRSIERFPQTGIYYLLPHRDKFDILHKAVASSGICFNENKWPYNPHCTVRSGPEPTEEADTFVRSIKIPVAASIKCFSLYQPKLNGGFCAHRF